MFRLPLLTAEALVTHIATRAGEFDAIVLHMSPYGYQKRGVPFWLASGWRQLSQMKGHPRLVTMYHELYATSSMRSSAFWLRPLQKWVLREVARTSDGLRTNRQPYADWLLNLPDIKAPEVVVMPVFSNLGEPEQLPPFSERSMAMAMFAWGIHSGESLSTVLEKAFSHCRNFGLNTLHLIGGNGSGLSVPPGIEMVHHGFMEAEVASRLLGSCRMAYTAYSPQHFGKSGLMAAFAVHGLAVITQGKTEELPDGLKEGGNVVHESTLVDQPQLEKIGAALRAWYDGHSLKQNAASYARQILAVAGE